MDWDHLRFVLAVARGGTLSAAARRLGVDQTTAARRLKAAERALAARLFDRVDGGFRPTAAGLAAVARAEAIEHEVGALAAAVGGADAAPAGTVRLTAVPILVNRLLIPAVPALQRVAPRLRLELLADNRDLSLVRREADIALRLARPRDGAMLARRVGRLPYAAYARRGADAGALPWISYGEGLAHVPQARWIAAHGGGAPGMLAVADAETLLHAVRAGLGRSLLPCFVGDGERALARLGSAALLARDLWLLVQREQRHLARIGAVIAWIEATLARLPPAADGARPDRRPRPGAPRRPHAPDEPEAGATFPGRGAAGSR